MRTVILHGHIFKNAGTTFDLSLERNFGDRLGDHRDDLEMRGGGAQYLESFLEDHPEIEALSSHHLNFSISQSNALDFISCYILRNPISRIRSVYNFERQQKSDSLGAKTAKKLSFLEDTLWRMRDDVPNTIRNHHSGRSYFAQNVMDSPETRKMIEVLDELGTEANYVFSKNLYDYRLYHRANACLIERAKSIPDFEDKLRLFRKRCSLF